MTFFGINGYDEISIVAVVDFVVYLIKFFESNVHFVKFLGSLRVYINPDGIFLTFLL